MKPHQRARILAEWRGLPEPPERPDRTVAAAEGVRKVMQALGLGERLREEEVLASWRGIVGDFIATHSQPSKLVNGVLIVQVLQPTMHYELDRVWKTKILTKMKERFGARTIKEIRFRIG
jgi:predicted nucleic acid-binding Zn ribbon protein